MKPFTTIVIVMCCFAPAVLLAQSAQEKIELTREVIHAQKKLLVSNNMELTEQAAQKFWPVYEDYQKALNTLEDRHVKVVEDYAKHYEALTDKQAKSLLTEILAITADRVELQQAYLPKFEKILSAKMVARYYQIENKMHAIIQNELAAGIPLVR